MKVGGFKLGLEDIVVFGLVAVFAFFGFDLLARMKYVLALLFGAYAIYKYRQMKGKTVFQELGIAKL